MSIFESLESLNFVDAPKEALSIEDLENEEIGVQSDSKDNTDDLQIGDNSSQDSSLDDEALDELKDFEDLEDNDSNKDNSDVDLENDTEDNSSSDESFSPVTSLASSLFEEGVLASLSEEEVKNIKSGEDLINAVRKQIKQNEFSDLTEEQKDYLDAIRDGVSLEDFAKSKEAYESYNSITDEVIEDEENKDLRFQVIRNSFLLKGFSSEKAEKLAKRTFDAGDDLEEAKSALEELKSYEKEKIETIKSQKREEQQKLIKYQEESFNEIKNIVKTREEIIPGVKLNDEVKKSVEQLISKPFTKDKNGNTVNEVVGKMINDKEYFVKLHYLHHITEGFTKFDKLVNKAKSQAVKSLEEKLKLQDRKLSTGTQNPYNKAKNEGLFKAIDKFL